MSYNQHPYLSCPIYAQNSNVNFPFEFNFNQSPMMMPPHEVLLNQYSLQNNMSSEYQFLQNSMILSQLQPSKDLQQQSQVPSCYPYYITQNSRLSQGWNLLPENQSQYQQQLQQNIGTQSNLDKINTYPFLEEKHDFLTQPGIVLPIPISRFENLKANPQSYLQNYDSSEIKQHYLSQIPIEKVKIEQEIENKHSTKSNYSSCFSTTVNILSPCQQIKDSSIFLKAEQVNKEEVLQNINTQLDYQQENTLVKKRKLNHDQSSNQLSLTLNSQLQSSSSQANPNTLDKIKEEHNQDQVKKSLSPKRGKYLKQNHSLNSSEKLMRKRKLKIKAICQNHDYPEENQESLKSVSKTSMIDKQLNNNWLILKENCVTKSSINQDIFEDKHQDDNNHQKTDQIIIKQLLNDNEQIEKNLYFSDHQNNIKISPDSLQKNQNNSSNSKDQLSTLIPKSENKNFYESVMLSINQDTNKFSSNQENQTTIQDSPVGTVFKNQGWFSRSEIKIDALLSGDISEEETQIIKKAISINKQNTNKNLIKAFSKYVNAHVNKTYDYNKQTAESYYYKLCLNSEVIENTFPTEKESAAFFKKFNKFINNKTYTNSHIKQIIQNKIYGQILFFDYLQNNAMTWLESANVQNKEVYQTVIQFYTLCCKYLQLLELLNDPHTSTSVASSINKQQQLELDNPKIEYLPPAEPLFSKEMQSNQIRSLGKSKIEDQ